MAVGDPTGEDLCVGTTDGDTLPASPDAPEWRKITFGSSTSLVSGVKYAIVVRATEAAFLQALLWMNNQGLEENYSDGALYKSTDSGETWNSYAGLDACFKTYKDGVTLCDSFQPTDPTHGAGVYSTDWYAQTFTATSDYDISDVALLLRTQPAGNTGTVTVSIRATVGAPEKPTNPTPTDTADDVTLDQATISWEDGGGATSYDVYYGENEEGLTLVSEGQAETSFTISGIDYGSPFDYVISRSWRIDAINDAGTTTGDVWTFTTIVFDPPLPTGVTLDAEGNPTGTPTGENNMYTVKRLIAAANNAIWYGGV